MNNFIEKINFKKVAILYIIIALLVGIGLLIFIGNKFQNKLEFIYEYHNISKNFEKNNYNLEKIKEEIKNLSENSQDIVDVLILNNENQILYSSKNSELGKQGQFELDRKDNKTDEYYTNPNMDNAIFRLTSDKELMLTTVLSNFDTDVKKDYEDEVFFEKNLSEKNLYVLSYAINDSTGEKIYFINEIHPVIDGKAYIKMALAIIMFLFMIYWIIVAVFIYQDALKSKLNPYLWGGITLFTNLAGVIIYIIYKQNNKTCFKCKTVQNRNNVYCTYCGTKLDKTCKTCGATINVHDKYCGRCGEKQI